MSKTASALILLSVMFTSASQAQPNAPRRGPTPQNPCGLSPNDWCPSPPGDPCGAHHNVEECRADPRCGGMPYAGESAVACQFDRRGFGLNCPTVGCVTDVGDKKKASGKAG